MAWESLRLTPSGWSFSRCLLFARLLQVLGTLITAVVNGFLLVYIHVNRLGLTTIMLYLEIMVCLALIYSGIVLLVQHSGSPQRRSSPALISTFVAGDVVFNGLTIAVITILARTGLPTDCHGLTRSDVEVGDAPNIPPPGYGTIRFGDGDIKGLLDRYCGIERGFYFIAAILVCGSWHPPHMRLLILVGRFTYMITVTLGVLRIFEQRWDLGRKDPLSASTNNVYELDHIRSKIHSPNPVGDLENAAPSSEGVITPAPRSNQSLRTQGFRSSSDMHMNRTFREQAQSQPLPVSPVSAASPISQVPVSPISPVAHQFRSFKSTPGVPDASMGGLMIDHRTDPAAEAAMVTDGYRHRVHPGTGSLPPYSPGQSRGQFMDGHGDESNEMRLSEYVKGETRAQRMKDAGSRM
ncbi:hypothetical protein F4804DRAFT_84306 [Jackrogersella minutella]|nr:hypothetical protein F4804DRAFT_84306 [Jackrogersella minutella]